MMAGKVAPAETSVLDPAVVARLAAQARSQDVALLGRDGLLQQLTKRFLEAALKRGARFIRIVLLVVILGLVARLGWDQLHA